MTIAKLGFGSNCVQNVCVVLLIVLTLTILGVVKILILL